MSNPTPGGEVIDLAFERAKGEARELLERHPSLRTARTADYLAEESSPMSATQFAHLTLRLPTAAVARVEALVPLAAAAPELVAAGKVTRSDVLRVAVLRGLAQLESELADVAQPGLPLE